MIANRHPRETTLALHAGGDLGPIAAWRTARHLHRCQACREEIAAFRRTRRLVADLPAMPEIPWSRLEAEMQANIRLGLAEGECVGGQRAQTAGMARFAGLRAALALASLAVVVAAGLMLRHPPAARVQTVLQATADGIQLSQGGEALGMKHDAAIGNVSYSANAQGSIGESYVDPLTGDVTMTRVSW
jgi:anti-sigma factor ChrR (cupin superfamily)